MRRHTGAVIAVVLLLVLGGATAVAANPSQVGGGQTSVSQFAPTGAEPFGQVSENESDANEDNASVRTEGFDPSYDPETVLARVEALRELRATEDVVLHEYDDENESAGDVPDQFGAIGPAGARALQLFSNGSTDRRLPLGYAVDRDDAVHVYLMDETDVRAYGLSQEVVLAHELTHALQFQHDLISPSRRALRDDFESWTTDAQLVVTSLVEGDAMWVTEEYRERYGGGENFSAAGYNRTLDRAAWTHSVAGLPYYYGYQFYAATDSDPSARSAILRNPPNATAPLLHPARPVPRRELPPEPDVDDAENLSRYHTDTVGEMVVRHALRVNGLSFPRAADAAEGWAGDRMYYYSGVATSATHWVTVWENENEARAFTDAWREMLAERGATEVDGTLVVPATEEASSVAYVVDREGATVRLTAAPTPELARRLADAATSENATAGDATSPDRVDENAVVGYQFAVTQSSPVDSSA